MGKGHHDDAPLAHRIRRLDGPGFSLEIYRGLPLMVVNTASDGPFADQYGALQLLYDRYAPLGLEVLAFPCDDFGHEPNDGDRLVRTLRRRYHVSFPLCEKVTVTGSEAHPLWRDLVSRGPERTRGPVTDDFTKFLIDPDGYVVERLGPEIGPLDPRLLGLLTDSLPTMI